jgi:hypothetical protein
MQTNRFCRAADIAVTLRRAGVVITGGFHVGGIEATSLPPTRHRTTRGPEPRSATSSDYPTIRSKEC